MEPDDDDAEDVTHMAFKFDVKEAMEEIKASTMEVPLRLPTVANVIATKPQAVEWSNDTTLHLIDSNGYNIEDDPHNQGSSTQFPHTSEAPEDRWTYYKRPPGHPLPKPTEIPDGTDMENMGDNDPFLAALKASDILADTKYHQALDSIEEGREGDTERYYNDDLGPTTNPHGTNDSKRYKGRRTRDSRKHNAIINNIESAKGIYCVEMNMKMQHDSGANICVTNNPRILIHLQDTDLKVKGCSDDVHDMQCTKVGYLPWYARATFN